MNKKFILGLILLPLIFLACKTTSNKSLGGDTERDSEGWVDDNTFEMVVIGIWDRSRYYIEGDDDPESGKEPGTELQLKDMSKRAASTKAVRDFKEKMGVYVQSLTKVKDSKLIGDEVETQLSGISLAPKVVKVQYTKDFDARATVRFEAKGLKKTVDAVAVKVLEKQNQ